MPDHSWYLEDFVAGDSVVSMGRTITETDIVNFVAIGGIFEELFINIEHADNRVPGGRVAPAMLVLTVSEGLYILTGHTHAGRAFLGLDELRLVAPTRAGDTIRVEVQTESARPSSSKPGHGVVVLRHSVTNQHGTTLMTYRTTRLIQARPNGTPSPSR